MNYPTRYTPGREVDSLRREVFRLFDDLLPSNDSGSNNGAVWSPRADVRETDEAYLLHLDLPGTRKEDVDVTMEDGTLRISGERKMVQEEGEDGQYHRIERRYGRFFRTFRFGQNADPERIEARFHDGELTVRVPKAEQRKPRRIEIQ